MRDLVTQNDTSRAVFLTFMTHENNSLRRGAVHRLDLFSVLSTLRVLRQVYFPSNYAVNHAIKTLSTVTSAPKTPNEWSRMISSNFFFTRLYFYSFIFLHFPSIGDFQTKWIPTFHLDSPSFFYRKWQLDRDLIEVTRHSVSSQSS